MKNVKGNYKKIMIALLLIGTTISLCACGKKDTKVSENLSTNKSNNNSIQSATTWDDYSIIIDGNEINLPIKVSDFLNMGFYEMDTSYGDSLSLMVKPNSSLGGTQGRIRGNDISGLFTNGTTSNINILIYNDSDEEKEVRDCYIWGIRFDVNAFNKANFKMGEVKVVDKTKNAVAILGETKYEDAEKAFGSHYEYDATNCLTYYPDKNTDGAISASELDSWRTLSMLFDVNTKVFTTSEFTYYDIGDLNK